MHKPSPLLRGSTTALGFAPALAVLLVTGKVCEVLLTGGILWVLKPHVFANTLANLWMFGVLIVLYVLWFLGAVRGVWSWATGGGLTVAGASLFLRFVAEWPQMIAQTPLILRPPPEPYGTVLVLGRGLGIVACAFGVACVVGACLAERRLRRSAPAWALPR